MKPYQDKEILEMLYSEYGSCEKVAKVIGCNPKTVHAWAKKLNVKLKEKFKGANKKHYFNEHYFDVIDTPEKAYWLGFIYADGCIYKGASPNSYRLQINLTADDKYHLEAFQKCLGSNYKIQEKIVITSPSALLKVNSTTLCLSLMEKGVLPKKSLTLSPPNFLEEEYISHFVRGYFDGDGSFKFTGRKDAQIRIQFLGTKKMIQWIEKIVKEIHSFEAKPYQYRKLWALEIGQLEAIQKIGGFLYKGSTVQLNRKYERFKNHLSSVERKK